MSLNADEAFAYGATKQAGIISEKANAKIKNIILPLKIRNEGQMANYETCDLKGMYDEQDEFDRVKKESCDGKRQYLGCFLY